MQLAQIICINILFLINIYFVDGVRPVHNYPEVINWRDTVADTYPSIITAFSDVINDNAPIKYTTGSRKARPATHEIKTFDLGADGTIVWKLCDAVDINMMGMDVVDSIDTNLVKKANKKGFDKVCRLVNLDQLDALPAGSVYLLISDSRENIIASYIFNSDEMEANQDNYEEYQKSYGLTLGAIVS